MLDDDALKPQKMIKLSDLPESVQQDIRIILRYIELQEVLEDNEDEHSNETQDRDSD